jgi:hypothetical protein
MNREMLMLVDAISREKNVERDVVFGAVELALAQATKKGIVFGSDVAGVTVSRNGHQLAPWLFQKPPRSRGLGHRDTQLAQQGFIGWGIEQGRDQPIQLGAGGFFVQSRRGGRWVQGRIHVNGLRCFKACRA